jgi:hypothetical protein
MPRQHNEKRQDLYEKAKGEFNPNGRDGVFIVAQPTVKKSRSGKTYVSVPGNVSWKSNK